MIDLIVPVAAGNALRVIFTPDAGADAWRLLRNTTGTFSGYNDATAVTVSDTDTSPVTDISGLANGTTYFYALFSHVNGAWSQSAVASAVPQATYQPLGPDVLSLVRDRLAAGLAVEILRGTLKPQSGKVEVRTAPPQFEGSNFPIVSVHLETEEPGQRGVGEQYDADTFDALNNVYTESEGWLATTRLRIVLWSMNPDERISLRKAVRSVLIANLTVFDELGLTTVTFSASDLEDFESYGAPVYMTQFSFSCLSPALVSDTAQPITTVTSTIAGL